MDDAGLQEPSAIDTGAGKPDGGIKVGIVGNSGGSAIDTHEAGETDGGIKVSIVGNSGGSATDTRGAGDTDGGIKLALLAIVVVLQLNA